MKINGWTILFHPLFDNQRQDILRQVKSLRLRLTTENFVRHPQVKLFKALTVGIEEKIPQNPLASYFALKRPLQKYSRLKKMGLPQIAIGFFLKYFPNKKQLSFYGWAFLVKKGIKRIAIVCSEKWFNKVNSLQF